MDVFGVVKDNLSFALMFHKFVYIKLLTYFHHLCSQFIPAIFHISNRKTNSYSGSLNNASKYLRQEQEERDMKVEGSGRIHQITFATR